MPITTLVSNYFQSEDFLKCLAFYRQRYQKYVESCQDTQPLSELDYLDQIQRGHAKIGDLPENISILDWIEFNGFVDMHYGLSELSVSGKVRSILC